MMNDFERKEISKLATYISRGVTPKYADAGYRVINQRCIRDNRVSYEIARYSSTKKKVSEQKFVRKWDVLVNSTGVGTLGRVAQVKDDVVDTTVDTHVTILRPDLNKVDGAYFGYSVIAEESLIEKLGAGATGQTELSRDRISDVAVSYTSAVDTQKKIAAILSAYDDLIENNNRRIKILEEMAQRLYREWFVDFRFPGHEDADFYDSGTEFGEIPVGWEVKKVGDLLAPVKSRGKIKKSDYETQGLYPIIDQGRDEVAGYTSDVKYIYQNDLPAIVFGDHTRILKYVNYPFARGADGTQVLRSNSERMPMPLFYLSLVGINLQSQAYARHYKFLKSKQILLPDQETAEEGALFFSPLFSQIRELRNQNMAIVSMRDLLLPKLITGEIEV